ncbi:hypothetical protein Tco_0066897 [Tanacetum coccineum]
MPIKRKPNDDHSIGHFDNDLVQDSAPYHTSEEEELYEEYRGEKLGNPRQEPPFCKIRRFEMIKYSFGPAEKYIAIKECEHDDLTRTEEDACYAYQGIFHIMDEGWYGYIKNHKKTVKNRQARTRESVEYKAEARKVKPQSKSAKKSQILSRHSLAQDQAQVHVSNGKAHKRCGICTKLTHKGSTSCHIKE